MKRLILLAALVAVAFLASYQNPADVVSQNLSTAADNFKIMRRIVFFDTWTDKYLLEITGLCSLGNNDTPTQVTVTCKTGPDKYKKHFLGLSGQVTYFAEQIDGANVSPYYYKVMFRPNQILPNISMDATTKLPGN